MTPDCLSAPRQSSSLAPGAHCETASTHDCACAWWHPTNRDTATRNSLPIVFFMLPLAMFALFLQRSHPTGLFVVARRARLRRAAIDLGRPAPSLDAGGHVAAGVDVDLVG